MGINTSKQTQNVAVKIDFLIIGAQKAGTSALDHYLRLHPEIGMANNKELHFFDDETVFFKNQPDYSLLHSKFTLKKDAKIYGEATPNYLFWTPSIKRIWEYNKKMKLIAILRNPIARAYSHWNMEFTRNMETLPFFEAVQLETQRCREAFPLQHRVFSYIQRGFYTEQIRRVMSFFPVEQVLFIKYEDYLNRQEFVLKEVFAFLNVNPTNFAFTPVRVNKNVYANDITKRQKELLLKIYEDDIKEVERLLDWNCEDWIRLL